MVEIITEWLSPCSGCLLLWTWWSQNIPTACGINPTFQLLGSKQHLPLVVIVTSLWHHKKSPLNAMYALVRPTPDALAFLLVSVKKIAMKSWEELCCWLAPSGLFFHTWLLKFHPLWSLSTVSQSPDDLVKARMMASGEVGNPTNLKNQCSPVPSISYVTSKHSLRSYILNDQILLSTSCQLFTL